MFCIPEICSKGSSQQTRLSRSHEDGDRLPSDYEIVAQTRAIVSERVLAETDVIGAHQLIGHGVCRVEGKRVGWVGERGRVMK